MLLVFHCCGYTLASQVSVYRTIGPTLVQISFHAGFSVFTVLTSRIYSRIRRNLPADAILGILVFN